MILSYLKNKLFGLPDSEQPSVTIPAHTSGQTPGLDMEIDRTIRTGFIWLIVGLGGFLAWAAWAPLDEGVTVQGSVTVDTKRKSVQHPLGGIIEKVLVKEGQQVSKGEVLVTLDDASTRAEFESVRQRYLGLRAMESRLLAENAGDKTVTFHPDVESGKADPLVQQHILTQSELFRSRMLALQSELASVAEAIQGQEAGITGFRHHLDGREHQLVLVDGELKGLRELVEQEYAPRNKLWELERNRLQIVSDIGELRSNIIKSQRTIDELSLRRVQRAQEARKETATQLAEVQREVSADAERFKSSGDDLERTRIKAPVDGYVVGIANQTVGGVVGPGARLMDIIPKDELLMLEAHVPPHLIDQIRTGLPADVRFSGFVDAPSLMVEGRVNSVSADLLTDPVTNLSYYLARISVTPQGLKKLDHHHLQPGMPSDIVIKTGERSLLRYLFDPLLKRLHFAMKEA